MGEVAGEVERCLAREIAIDFGGARWITTGAGSSEGPARLLATLLRARGVVAEYAPISSFIDGVPRAADAPGGPNGCVVVSQRLSPNARFPIARVAEYERMVLVTSVEDAPRNVEIARHGPREEDGLFLRVIGPAAAGATILRLASATSPPNVASALASSRARALGALAESGARADALFDVAAIVTTGELAAHCVGLEHKLLEGLGRAAPIVDLCALVHGPLQSFYDRDAVIIVLARDATRALMARLARVLNPERHRVVRLESSLPRAFARVDFDLMLDHLLVEALRARPRDLADWPGKGRDSALYDLGGDLRPPF